MAEAADSVPFLGNASLLCVKENVPIETAKKQIKDGKALPPGCSVAIFTKTVEPAVEDLRDLLNDLKEMPVKAENYVPIKDELVYEKKREMFTKEGLQAAVQKAIDNDVPAMIQNKKDLKKFLREHDKHLKNQDVELIGRDLELETDTGEFYLNGISQLDDKGVITGINTSYHYLGTRFSSTAIHDEDSRLSSGNVLLKGTTIWFVVDHLEYTTIIKKVHKIFEQYHKTDCDKEILHKCYFLTLKLLESLGINFVCFTQKAGDMVYVRGGSFFQVVNVDLNLSEAINIADVYWHAQIGCDIEICACRKAPMLSISPDRSKKFKIVPLQRENLLCRVETCHARFPNHAKYIEHMVTVHKLKPYKCSKCPSEFNRKDNLDSHMKSHEEPQEVCKECHQTVRNLKKHMADCHSEKLICPKCNNPIKQKNYAKHVQECTTYCDKCKRTFPSFKS